jgi:hypothetical protein
MDQLTVIGQQQQAGGVLVEPADALDVPRDQRRRQQCDTPPDDAWASASIRGPPACAASRYDFS